MRVHAGGANGTEMWAHVCASAGKRVVQGSWWVTVGLQEKEGRLRVWVCEVGGERLKEIPLFWSYSLLSRPTSSFGT